MRLNHNGVERVAATDSSKITLLVGVICKPYGDEHLFIVQTKFIKDVAGTSMSYFAGGHQVDANVGGHDDLLGSLGLAIGESVTTYVKQNNLVSVPR